MTVAEYMSELVEMNSLECVRSFPSYRVSARGEVIGPWGRVLTPSVTKGYRHVSLSNGGEKQTVKISVLVAKAFLGEAPFEGALVAHNDGNSQHDYLTNLRWASSLENQADRQRHKTYVRGEAVFGAKLTEPQVKSIRAHLLSGRAVANIAGAFGVSTSTIHLIKKNRIWRHVDV